MSKGKNKMTITEKRILEAINSPIGNGTDWGGGVRYLKAARRLEEKGLLTVTFFPPYMIKVTKKQ